MPETITSRRNEIVRTAARLSDSAEYRRERGLYFLEGARLCADAALSGVPVRTLLYTQSAGERYEKYLAPVRRCARETYLVGPQAAEAMSRTKTTQGVFCICELPAPPSGLPEQKDGRGFLALEDLQDPANLGTILRTAEALGVDGVLLGGSCCDLYSPKVLRASMGAVFRLRFFTAADLEAAVLELNRRGFLTAAAVPDPGAKPVTALDFSKPCVLAVGNEGSGLKEGTRSACAERTTIPMPGRAESLNASAAAAILIWEMVRGRTGGEAS